MTEAESPGTAYTPDRAAGVDGYLVANPLGRQVRQFRGTCPHLVGSTLRIRQALTVFQTVTGWSVM